MLVLTRKHDEEIVISLGGGKTIEISVVGIRNSKVRLGFTAPREIAIHRREIYEAIRRGEDRPPKTEVA